MFSDVLTRLAMRGRALEGIRWGVLGQLRLELPLSLRRQSVRGSVHYSTVDRLLLWQHCFPAIRGQAGRVACDRRLMPLHLGLVEASRL